MSTLEARVADLESCRIDLFERLKGVGKDGQPRSLHGFEGLIRDMRTATRRALALRKRMDPVAWAERYLYLPQQTSPAQPGQLRLTEYQKQAIREMLAPSTRFYIRPKSVQVGFSLECAVVVIFYVLAPPRASRGLRHPVRPGGRPVDEDLLQPDAQRASE